jgi:hypothetical protein
MMTYGEAMAATLDQLTDELAAAGWDSTQQTREEALEAVLALIAETQLTLGIKTMNEVRINLMAGVAVEALDNNGAWVLIESGATFESREEAQEYIDGLPGQVKQHDDVAW